MQSQFSFGGNDKACYQFSTRGPLAHLELQRWKAAVVAGSVLGAPSEWKETSGRYRHPYEWLFSRVLLSSWNHRFAYLSFYIHSWIRYLHTGWGCTRGHLTATHAGFAALRSASPRPETERTHFRKKTFVVTEFKEVLFRSDLFSFWRGTFVYKDPSETRLCGGFWSLV